MSTPRLPLDQRRPAPHDAASANGRVCKSLLVLLQGGRSNGAALQVAADLAGRWQAHAAGLGLALVVPNASSAGELDGTLLQALHEELQRELQVCEEDFRKALGGRAASLGWQGHVDYLPLVDQAARAARGADLLLTSRSTDGFLDASRHLDVGDLVLQCGRPVLVVPQTLTGPLLQHTMVAWQDTRESRRAVADALPLLQLSAQVTLAQVAPPEQADQARAGLDDVAAWLGRHGVEAETVVSVSSGIDGEALYTLAQNGGVDLVVAGAFGHSRLREWLLGGVTRDTLLQATCCVMLSH